MVNFKIFLLIHLNVNVLLDVAEAMGTTSVLTEIRTMSRCSSRSLYRRARVSWLGLPAEATGSVRSGKLSLEFRNVPPLRVWRLIFCVGVSHSCISYKEM